jgi:hypothetical protein
MPPFLHPVFEMVLSHASDVGSTGVSLTGMLVEASLSLDCCNAGGEMTGDSRSVESAVEKGSSHARVKTDDVKARGGGKATRSEAIGVECVGYSKSNASELRGMRSKDGSDEARPPRHADQLKLRESVALGTDWDRDWDCEAAQSRVRPVVLMATEDMMIDLSLFLKFAHYCPLL